MGSDTVTLWLGMISGDEIKGHEITFQLVSPRLATRNKSKVVVKMNKIFVWLRILAYRLALGRC